MSRVLHRRNENKCFPPIFHSIFSFIFISRKKGLINLLKIAKLLQLFRTAVVLYIWSTTFLKWSKLSYRNFNPSSRKFVVKLSVKLTTRKANTITFSRNVESNDLVQWQTGGNVKLSWPGNPQRLFFTLELVINASESVSRNWVWYSII